MLSRCDACGRPSADVTKLFKARSPDVAVEICNFCVDECAQAIADVPTRIPGGMHACAYCAKLEDQVAVVVGVGAKKICDECVDAYRADLT